MSTQVPVAFVNNYRENVIHLAQQKGAKLLGCVSKHTDVVGKADHFERIGATSARKVTTRHADSPLVNTPHSRRRSVLEPYDWGDLIDKEDERRLIIDPAGEYVKAGYRALGRSIDDVIITAALGTATSVDETDAGSSVTFPASQQIVHGGTTFTLSKWRDALQIMDDQDVEEEDRCLWISPRAINKLLGDTQVTSADFAAVKALVNGEINSYLGCRVIKTTRLPKTGNIRSAVLMQMEGIGLSMGSDIQIEMERRADKRFALYVYGCMDLGATRIEEARVVEIQYDESV